jgi:acetylornithine deacetylase/succinyl-diaminopimelate desuccinylase-like protein
MEFAQSLAMFHGNNERVSVRSVDLTTRLLEATLVRFGELSRAER